MTAARPPGTIIAGDERLENAAKGDLTGGGGEGVCDEDDDDNAGRLKGGSHLRTVRPSVTHGREAALKLAGSFCTAAGHLCSALPSARSSQGTTFLFFSSKTTRSISSLARSWSNALKNGWWLYCFNIESSSVADMRNGVQDGGYNLRRHIFCGRLKPSKQ